MDKEIEKALNECEAALEKLRMAIKKAEPEVVEGWEITSVKRPGVPCLCWDGEFCFGGSYLVVFLHISDGWDHYAYHPELTARMQGWKISGPLLDSLLKTIRAKGITVHE